MAAQLWWPKAPPQVAKVQAGLGQVPEVKPGGLDKIGSTLSALDAYNEIWDRPLFFATRRPAPASDDLPKIEEPPAQPMQIEPPKVTLKAVVISPKGKTVMLADQTNGATLRLVTGETVQGWAVADIDSETATLRNGNQETLLVLRDFSKPASPAAGSPSVAAAKGQPGAGVRPGMPGQEKPPTSDPSARKSWRQRMLERNAPK